ncbi:MAG: bifunctional phosphopantothenoylcysteine decarboxylase/phosphopantothenate--cysteine ligase CoaBC [Actinomycetales bacterium]
MITFPSGREVVLGVGAGIAAYKSCDLLRRLQDHNFSVTVIPTSNSFNFVGRTTWEALSGRPAPSDLWESKSGVAHVDYAKQADLMVIAPATADLISRIATGRADDLLTTTLLAAKCPILVVPAMHPEMYLNLATQNNISILRERGITVMEPAVGKLTSGDEGIGRFPETESIINQVEKIVVRQQKLQSTRILVTAGGTQEALDPVRFIGNRSSGRQGLEIAYQAKREGAEVTLIAGATEEFELSGVKTIRVETTLEMQRALKDEIESADALIMAAAVADARPEKSEGKIAKENLGDIKLIMNPDLLAELSRKKRADQIFVGFAAETNADLKERGLRKLHQKGVDLLYVTDVSGGKVFGESTSSGILLSKRGEAWSFPNNPKSEIAREIVEQVAKELTSVKVAK